jgi:ferredoxin
VLLPLPDLVRLAGPEDDALCDVDPEEWHDDVDAMQDSIDDDDYLQVDDPTVTDENRDRVEKAVAACPKSALSIVED